MTLSDLKFSEEMLSGSDISSLPDVPSQAGITAQELKSRFDKIGKSMLALGNFNALIDMLSQIKITVGDCAKPFDGGNMTFTAAEIGCRPRLITLTLPAEDWSGTASPYTQSVTAAGASADSAVDLRPDAEAVAAMHAAGVIALYIGNDGGTLTAYAVGGRPCEDMTLQASITEVIA